MESTLLDTLAQQGAFAALLGVVLWLGYKLYQNAIDRAAVVSDREAAESAQITASYIKHLEGENATLLNHFLASTPSLGASPPPAGSSGQAQSLLTELLDDAFPDDDEGARPDFSRGASA